MAREFVEALRVHAPGCVEVLDGLVPLAEHRDELELARLITRELVNDPGDVLAGLLVLEVVADDERIIGRRRDLLREQLVNACRGDRVEGVEEASKTLERALEGPRKLERQVRDIGKAGGTVGLCPAGEGPSRIEAPGAHPLDHPRPPRLNIEGLPLLADHVGQIERERPARPVRLGVVRRLELALIGGKPFVDALPALDGRVVVAGAESAEPEQEVGVAHRIDERPLTIDLLDVEEPRGRQAELGSAAGKATVGVQVR